MCISRRPPRRYHYVTNTSCSSTDWDRKMQRRKPGLKRAGMQPGRDGERLTEGLLTPTATTTSMTTSSLRLRNTVLPAKCVMPRYLGSCRWRWFVSVVLASHSISVCLCQDQDPARAAGVLSPSDRHVEPFRGPCARKEGVDMGKGGTAPWVCRFETGFNARSNSILSRGTSQLARTSEMDGSGGIVALVDIQYHSVLDSDWYPPGVE